MNLGALIERLMKEDPDKVVRNGFDGPHSYRGYYDQLAFHRARNVTVRSMLACAQDCIGRTFTGYKGGEYRMDLHTPIWLGTYGTASDGEELSATLLDYMLREGIGPLPIDSTPAERDNVALTRELARQHEVHADQIREITAFVRELHQLLEKYPRVLEMGLGL